MYLSACVFLALFIRSTEMCPVKETIAGIIPEHVKKSFICLVNTNMTFEFPTSRFYGKNGLFWNNPGNVHLMPDLYIIDLSQGDDLEDVLFDLHRNVLFDPRATHLLVAKEVNQESLLNALKKFYIVEGFVVDPKGNTYRFNRKLSKMSPVRKQEVVFQQSTKAPLSETRNITLRVGYLKKPPFVICPECPTNKGIEIEVFDLAANYLNVKVEYIQYRTTYWGDKLNGSYNFLYKEIFDRTFDVGFGQMFDFKGYHFDFDLTPIHVIDPIQFVVPKAKIIRQFNIFNYIFKKETILIQLLVLAMVFLMMCILNRWKNKLGKFLELVQINFDVPFDLHRVNRSSTRCLYIFLMFSIIAFNTAFKSKLFSTLTMEHFEYQIDSLEDIVHSNLVPMFNNRTEGYFDRDNPIDKFMDTNSPRTCGFELDCVDMVAFHRNVTTMKLKKTLEYYTPRKYVDKKGRALIHIIDEDVQKFYFRFFFVKGHPVFPRFSRIVETLLENGINEFISDKLREGNRKAQIKAEGNYHKIFVRRLKITHLLNVVYIYIAGIIISLLVFCAELLWH